MKIALEGTVFQHQITGIAKGTRCLYENSVRLGYDFDVTVVHREPLTCTFSPKIASAQVGSAVPNRLWRALVFPAYLARAKPELVHLPWNGRIPRFMPSSKVIITIHDVLPLAIPNYFASKRAELGFRKRVQNDLDRSDLVFTISKFSKNEILRNFALQIEPIVVNYASTLETHGKRQNRASEGHQDYFLYVGGYDKRKGIESLLRTFLRLHDQQRLQSKLILAGNKFYFSREFKALIGEGLKKNVVTELGYVEDSILADLYVNAKALVYPSKFEGFGLPPLEAMAMGCPVVTTNGTSIPEICGRAVCYTDPEDEEAFAQSLIDVEHSQELRDKLARRGLRQAAKFSWERSAKLFSDEVLRLIADS
jgi:glycosyltransferase involved in cell wall biosynthesis